MNRGTRKLILIYTNDDIAGVQGHTLEASVDVLSIFIYLLLSLQLKKRFSQVFIFSSAPPPAFLLSTGNASIFNAKHW